MTVEFTPFFLSSGSESLFCVYYPAGGLHQKDLSEVQVVIHLPAFAEEMNKSRRMVSLQAQALAQTGTASLVIDLFGTGDSAGDFSEARWELWKQNIEAAIKWLQELGYRAINFTALRLGGLLALDLMDKNPGCFEKLVWWQPVVVGETHLMQFLRLRVASAMFSKGQEEKETTKMLRERLLAGKQIEVAGYDIHPELAKAFIEKRAQDYGSLALKKIYMIELVSSDGKSPSPVIGKLLDQWSQTGLTVTAETLKGDQFWSTQEISTCPQLIEWTTAKFQ
jgi:exosortase A-associated hydrolase 2